MDLFYQLVFEDPELAPFFEGVEMDKHRRKFLLFVSYVLGGPDEYLQLVPEPWPQLYAVHERLIRDNGEGAGSAAAAAATAAAACWQRRQRQQQQG